MLLKEKTAKRFADPVGERRAGNEGKEGLLKVKKPCQNVVAREPEGQMIEIKTFCGVGFHPKGEKRDARQINKFGGI